MNVFFVLNKVRVWRPSWQHTFTLSSHPPQPPKRTSWFPLTNFRSLLPNNGMRVFRRVRPQDTYSVSKSIKLWSTAACAGTSPEATEKEQQSTLKLKTQPKYTTITLTLHMSRTVFLKSVKQAGWKKFRVHSIAHFTVSCTGRNEAGVDLVLIQPFLLYHVNFKQNLQ